MHRQSLLNKLSTYRAADDEERYLQKQVKQFVLDNPDCFERALAAGHITGAAWIVNPLRTHVLLTHHRKLNKWLQPGGHADGDTDIMRVAIREAQEESGIPAFIPLSDEIFDIDIHEIPPHKNIPRHLHYDIRFLLEADMKTEIKASDESHEIRWIHLDRVTEYTRESSILRMLRKTKKWSE
jgi:8-oxo-dGTP pyrophosphatase MutT (NUDIX family)